MEKLGSAEVHATAAQAIGTIHEAAVAHPDNTMDPENDYHAVVDTHDFDSGGQTLTSVATNNMSNGDSSVEVKRSHLFDGSESVASIAQSDASERSDRVTTAAHVNTPSGYYSSINSTRPYGEANLTTVDRLGYGEVTVKNPKAASLVVRLAEKAAVEALELDRSRGSLEALTEARDALASAFHEDWRKTRLQEDGSYEPREKPTSDEAWIATHGTDTVDIANTAYEDLPSDWQTENKAAADVVTQVLAERDGQVDLSDSATYNQVGHTIHTAWLERNDWARGGELDVPFEELPDGEKAKDIDQMRIAVELFSPAEAATWVGGPDSATGGYIGLDAEGNEVDMIFPDEFEH